MAPQMGQELQLVGDITQLGGRSTLDGILQRALKGYGTFFDELCLLMIVAQGGTCPEQSRRVAPPSRMSRALVGGLKPTLHYCGALGRTPFYENEMVPIGSVPIIHQ